MTEAEYNYLLERVSSGERRPFNLPKMKIGLSAKIWSFLFKKPSYSWKINSWQINLGIHNCHERMKSMAWVTVWPPKLS